MNIEEERKAFEADQLKRYPGVCLVRWPKVYRNQYVEAAFQGWLAAKKHAEEMANPKVVIEQSFPKSADSWTVINSFGDPVDYFRTAEEARVWATSNGYRVVEE